MTDLPGLPAAASIVAWCNTLARQAERLDVVGPGTRALCAAEVPVLSVASGPLLGPCLAAPPGPRRPGVPVLPDPLPEATESRERRVDHRLPEPPGPVEPGRLRDLAGPPDPVRRPAPEWHPNKAKVVGRAVRRRLEAAAECGPSAESSALAGEKGAGDRAEGCGGVERARAAVGQRIGCEPDQLAGVLRRKVKAGPGVAVEQLEAMCVPSGIELATQDRSVQPDEDRPSTSRSGRGRMNQGPSGAGRPDAGGLSSGRSRPGQVDQGFAGLGRPAYRAQDSGGSAGLAAGQPGAGRPGLGQPGHGVVGPEGLEKLGARRAEDSDVVRGSSRAGRSPGGRSRVDAANTWAGLEDRPGVPAEAGRPAGGEPAGASRRTGDGAESVESRVGGPDVIRTRWAEGTDELRLAGERQTGGWDDADVERVLERVLGDAARRHGIEV